MATSCVLTLAPAAVPLHGRHDDITFYQHIIMTYSLNLCFGLVVGALVVALVCAFALALAFTLAYLFWVMCLLLLSLSLLHICSG